MKKAFLVCAALLAFVSMTVCKGRSTNDANALLVPIQQAECDGVVFPDYAPNIEYLKIFDSLDSFGWFNMDTLWMMYDDNYLNADNPQQINGIPIVWFSNDEWYSYQEKNDFKDIGTAFEDRHCSTLDGELPDRSLIEYGYESHCDSHLYVSVYNIYYDENGMSIGAVHSFYTKDFLDSILDPNHRKKRLQDGTNSPRDTIKVGHRQVKK